MYNGSQRSQQCPGGEPCRGTASHSEALIPSPPLCVRQIRVSISVQLCACRLNPKWQPLRGPNGGEKSECQKFSAAPSEPKVTPICPPLCRSLASWWICHPRFSAQCMHFLPLAFLYPVFYYPWPSVACFFGNNNDVLQLPDLIRELR